ncbi:hypothetical protein ACOZ32_08970 [Halobacterium sp. MBLA0001]
MTLNPREYDPEELRSAARAGGDENIRELKERLKEHEQTTEEAVRSSVFS